jgi:hypothetical protein
MEPNLGPVIPGHPKDPSSQPGGDTVILSDVLGRDRSINIFAGFTRDISTVEARLGDGNANTTVLAPLNSAIMALPRKPWEDPQDYHILGADAYEGKDGEDRAHKNLRRFVEAHVVPNSPWEEGEKVETMTGGMIWWEMKDGKKIVSPTGRPGAISMGDILTESQVQPGNIEVTSIASRVANGEVWILKSVRNYA